MSDKPLTDDELAREAERWDRRQATPADWQDAPDSVVRHGESVAVSIRLPKPLLALLKEFARRKRVGYQVLLKRWLDDRVRAEYEQLRVEMYPLKLRNPKLTLQAASFEPKGVGHLSEDDTLDEFGRLFREIASQKTA
jgi:hypothetical protein